MSNGALNPLIHDPRRLRIVATLAALPDGDALSVKRLQDMTGLTPGSLITCLRELDHARYVRTASTRRHMWVGGRSLPVPIVTLADSPAKAYPRRSSTAANSRLCSYSLTSRDLPPPASAPTSTTCGLPAAASPNAPASVSISASRPTKTGLTLRLVTALACQRRMPPWAS